jgi:formylglycine-generating enzyme required for sulfatase activity
MHRFALTACLCLVIAASAALAQSKPKQYAVLIGINKYEHAKLPALQYAVNDATDLEKLLAAAGYEVALLTNETDPKPTRNAIDASLRAVLRKAHANDTVILAFAGHGLQFQGDKNSYFCPIDARPFKDQTKTLLSMGLVYAEMEKSFAGVKILLVDACRDDPDAGRGSRGIDADSAPRPPRGVAAFFSCSAGQKAYEHPDLKHGVFFHHVLQGLRGDAKNSKDEITFNSLVDYVGGNVERDVPKLIGGGAEQQPNQKADLKGRSPVLLELKGPRPGDVVEVKITDGVKMKFCWVPGGSAQLGSPMAERLAMLMNLNEEKEPDWLASEAEEKRGRFKTKGFWMGKYPVTQAEWQSVMRANPSAFKPGQDDIKNAGITDTGRFPVENVSWDDCQEFLKKLNGIALPATMGKGKLTLPHEDEWEYACRGGKGNKQAYYFGDELNGTKANCDGNFPFGTTTEGPFLKRTSKVGTFELEAPHPWGLCDMTGNVYQWCSNKYDNDRRVLRGGSWDFDAGHCRSASRGYGVPTKRSAFSGFRVVVLP